MFEPRPVIDLAREPIHSSGRRYALDVEARLDISARHLRVADWGRSLEPAWQARSDELRSTFPGLDHDVIVTAAQTMVFASSVTALDSCASSLAFWCGHVLNGGYEYDIGRLDKRRAGGKVSLPPWADGWLTSTTSDPRRTRTEDYRHRQLHRVVSRSHLVEIVDRIGPIGGTEVAHTSQFGPTIDPSGPSIVETYDDVVEFAIDRWSEFWTLLAADT